MVPHFDAWLGSGRVNKMGADDGDGGKIDMERERVTCRNQPLYLRTREHPPTRVAILTIEMVWQYDSIGYYANYKPPQSSSYFS